MLDSSTPATARPSPKAGQILHFVEGITPIRVGDTWEYDIEFESTGGEVVARVSAKELPSYHAVKRSLLARYGALFCDSQGERKASERWAETIEVFLTRPLVEEAGE